MSVIRFALTLWTLGVLLPATAQNYPVKTVRLISPFPPGGSVDVVGRLVAAKLSEQLGQQMVVDNRSGASGNIGTELVANAPADGYTLLIQTIPLVVNQFMLGRVPYDVKRDFAPVSLMTSSPSLITVHPSLPVRTVKELIGLAKAKPGKLNYSTAGPGTNPHIAGELFSLLAGINVVAIHFKGGGPADLATIGGEVEMTFGNVSQQIGYLNSGRLRALAITSAKRSPILPNLPTVAEAGVAGYEFITWHGILAPKATPQAIVTMLNENIKKLLTMPGQDKQWQDRGLDVIASTPAEFAAHLEAEQTKWGRVIKERGIKAE